MVERILNILNKDENQNIIDINDVPFTKESLKDFCQFYKIMENIRYKYQTDFRKLDIFLWREGKILVNQLNRLRELKEQAKLARKQRKN